MNDQRAIIDRTVVADAATGVAARLSAAAGFVAVASDVPDPPGLVRAPPGARLPQFVALRAEVTRQLADLVVAVIGAGSIGRRMCLELARTGVAGLYVVDPGAFKRESLITQPIGPDEVGRPKASDTARLCSRLNPATRTFAFDGPVQALPPDALAPADLVLLATDNLSAEVETGRRCLSLGKPLIQAAVHGETCVAQVRVLVDSCPACHYGAAEWEHYSRSTTFSCAGFGADAGSPLPQVATQPTRSVSPLCSFAADLALMQVLRFSPGLGGPLVDCLIEYCGYTNRVTTSPLAANPECPCDHTRWDVRPAPAPLAECSLADLAAAAGLNGTATVDSTGFEVDDLWFIESAICPCAAGGAAPARRQLARCGVSPSDGSRHWAAPPVDAANVVGRSRRSGGSPTAPPRPACSVRTWAARFEA